MQPDIQVSIYEHNVLCNSEQHKLDGHPYILCSVFWYSRIRLRYPIRVVTHRARRNALRQVVVAFTIPRIGKVKPPNREVFSSTALPKMPVRSAITALPVQPRHVRQARVMYRSFGRHVLPTELRSH